MASCTEVGQAGGSSSRCELEGTAESSGARHLAPSVFGAAAVPFLGGSTDLMAGENREREG